MKKIIGSMLAATIVFSSVALTGCSGKGKVNSESEQTLEIYVYNAGYGTDWLYAIKDEFVKEAWVKEKYPELVIDITQNEVEKYASDMLTASESTNKFEIIMGQVLNKHLGANGKAEDLTDTVYKAIVFGEDVTVEEKMYESTRKRRWKWVLKHSVLMPASTIRKCKGKNTPIKSNVGGILVLNLVRRIPDIIWKTL